MFKSNMTLISGSSKTAYELRERFVFKIVPMLNPDGVIVGNTRKHTSTKFKYKKMPKIIIERKNIVK